MIRNPSTPPWRHRSLARLERFARELMTYDEERTGNKRKFVIARQLLRELSLVFAFQLIGAANVIE